MLPKTTAVSLYDGEVFLGCAFWHTGMRRCSRITSEVWGEMVGAMKDIFLSL